MSDLQMSETTTEEQILEHVYSLLKARALFLGIPEKILYKYYRGVRDVLKRIENVHYGGNYLRLVILSSKASKATPEHTIVVRDLMGRLRKVTVGTPIEESYHHVIVSEHVMKCDCPVALRNASKADAWLEKFIKKKKIKLKHPEMIFSKHILCKHTLAGLVKAIFMGVVKITDDLIDNISLALIGTAIAEGYATPDREALHVILKHLPRK